MGVPVATPVATLLCGIPGAGRGGGSFDDDAASGDGAASDDGAASMLWHNGAGRQQAVDAV